MGGSSSTTTQSQSFNQQGSSTAKPIIPGSWQTGLTNWGGSLNNNGLNSGQQGAADYFNNSITNNPANSAISGAQGTLGNVGSGLAGLSANMGYNARSLGDISSRFVGMSSDPSYTLASLQSNYPSLYQAPAQVQAQNVSSQTGASMSDPYSQLYSQQLIDPSLNAYDYGTNKAFSALDARSAAGGAFGNSRNGLAYSDLGAQSALGRGQLEAGLKTTGLTNAFNLGQTDASRQLQADTTNAANNLAAQQFNSNMANNREQFDVGAAYQGDQMRMNALQGGQSALSAQGNALANQGSALNSLGANAMNSANLGVTQNNVGQQNAQNAFNAGSTGFSQPGSILSLGTSTFGQQNDSTSSGNSSGTSTTNTDTGIGGILGSIGSLAGGVGLFNMGGGFSGLKNMFGGGFASPTTMATGAVPSTFRFT